MSKFLVIVCAFGILLSSALAEEKSREQLREESNQLFGVEGVQRIELNRMIASGTKQQIGFFISLNPDCSASGDVTVRVTKQPEHGTAEITAAMNFPGFEKKICATNAISIKFEASKSITSQPRNTVAAIQSNYSFSTPADLRGKFSST